MSQRFFVYPVLFIVAMLLLPLLRQHQRWYAAQIAQNVLILFAALGAMVFENDLRWVFLAWGLFALFILTPRMLVRFRCWRWAGWLTWGRLGRLFRQYADARPIVDEAMPESVRGDVRVFELRRLTDAGDWINAIQHYRSVEDWGTLGAATRARLLAARAFAHTGDFEQAWRSLQFVALSPRTLGALENQYRAARDEIASLGGEVPEALRAAEEQSAQWRALLN